MNYTVLWMPVAEQRLAAIWTSATDRNAVSQAAHVIDQALQTDPEQVGESRIDDVRILFERPLGVFFTVSPEDRTVSVLSVWRSDSRRKDAH
jgi:plasmid stabilization system protein ParE